MEKDIKLSIIMPVYNAENYLNKTLESLRMCLKDGIEAVIVNDASTDSSKQIIEKFITDNKKKNIKFIDNKENSGAGKSKNIGIENSSGKYIGFLDSDDYVDKEYYNEMLKLAEKNKADIVVSDIVLDFSYKQTKDPIYHNNIYSSKDNGDIFIEKNTLYGYWACASACSKIFKKSLLKNLRFSSKNIDDLMFTIPAVEKANKIAYCRDKSYYYYQSDNSITRNDNVQKKIENLTSLFETLDYLLKNNKKESAQILATNSLYPYICVTLLGLHRKNVAAFVEAIKYNIEKYNYNVEEMINKNEYLKGSVFNTAKVHTEIMDLIGYNHYDVLIKRFSRSKIEKKLRTVLRLVKHNPDKLRYVINKKLNKNKKFEPLVSIVIPVYNGENYLKEAIDSALQQTYKNIEIIVVNDGSKDNTEKIALSYGKKIRYFKQENGGVSAALNTALSKMKGEYFSWLSHDDLYYPYKVEVQVDYLKYLKNKNVILFADYQLIDENGKYKGTPIRANHKMTKIQEYCLLRGCINGITMLIPKKAFDETGKFNTELRCTQDYDMWHRMNKKYKFVHMSEVTSLTRVHAGQDTNKNPRVVTEGEVLWTNMIEDVSDKRKKQLEGSIANYYKKMLEHLKYSPYEKTKELCEKKYKEYNENNK